MLARSCIERPAPTGLFGVRLIPLKDRALGRCYGIRGTADIVAVTDVADRVALH
jgi:hypothetical protein